METQAAFLPTVGTDTWWRTDWTVLDARTADPIDVQIEARGIECWNEDGTPDFCLSRVVLVIRGEAREYWDWGDEDGYAFNPMEAYDAIIEDARE